MLINKILEQEKTKSFFLESRIAALSQSESELKMVLQKQTQELNNFNLKLNDRIEGLINENYHLKAANIELEKEKAELENKILDLQVQINYKNNNLQILTSKVSSAE